LIQRIDLLHHGIHAVSGCRLPSFFPHLFSLIGIFIKIENSVCQGAAVARRDQKTVASVRY
jgi:hypothetical protein